MLIKQEKHLSLCCLIILVANTLMVRSTSLSTLENANASQLNSAEVHQTSANEPREAIIPILASAPEDLPYFPEAPDFPHVRLPQNDDSDSQEFDSDTRPVRSRSSNSASRNDDYEYQDDMPLKSDDFLGENKPVRQRNKFRNEKPAKRVENFYRDNSMRNQDSGYYNDKHSDDNFDDERESVKKSKQKNKPKKLYKAIERVYFYPRDEDDIAPNKNKKAMNTLKSYIPEDPYPTMTYDNHEIQHDDPIRNDEHIRHDDPIRHDDHIRHDEPIRHEHPIRHSEPIRREDYIQHDDPTLSEDPIKPLFSERKRRNPRSQKVHIDHGSDDDFRDRTDSARIDHSNRGNRDNHGNHGNHDDGTQALIANDAKEFGKEATDEANRFEKFLDNLKSFAANSEGEYDSPRERPNKQNFDVADDAPDTHDFPEVNSPVFHDTNIDHPEEDRTKDYDHNIGHYGKPNDYNREKMSYEAHSDKTNKDDKKGGHKYHKDRRRAKRPQIRPQITDEAFEQRRHEVASLIDEEPDEADYLSNSDVVSQLKKSELKYNTGIDPIYSSQRDFDEVKRLEKMIETVALLNKQKERAASSNHDQHEISESKLKKVEKKANKKKIMS